LVSDEGLFETIRENVPKKFVDVNLQAARQGMALAQEQNVSVEI